MISNNEFFHNLNLYCKEKTPFSCFRLPNKSIIECHSANKKKISKEKKPDGSGFIMMPFDTSKEGYLIHSDKIISTKSVKTISYKNPNLTKKIMELNIHKNDYLKDVSDIIEKIINSDLLKAVYSRVFDFNISSPNIFEYFKKLLNLYPEDFCYLFYHPDEGFWMGASPETLLKIQDGKLSTMALAGTKKIDNSTWGAKELNEQKIVQEEIRKNLMPFCDDLNFGKTKSSRAGNIDHIKTIISGNSSSSPREIIKVLHPTSATAGVPRKKALLNIYSKEKHNRLFYSGYLGLINDKNCNLYVNLRSMNIKNNIAKIFVGGGITKYSEPEKEWEEILQKSITMLNVLFD